ncbi:MAG: nucleotide exchange factor GrpE [Planctomycetota bacterium]|nr:nucleotide exchange factor GrpE [Planctomycetota bacterium]
MDDVKNAPAPDGDADGPPESLEGDAAETPGPESRVAELERELAELKGRLLRSAADYQNALRRAQQNIIEAEQLQLFKVAKALVPVLDHFDMALDSGAKATSAQSVLQGIQIVRDEMTKTLEGFGIQRIEAKPGDEFNPARHEAMLHQAVAGIAPDHVAAQFQAGYVLGERTLRPVKVSLSK